jgi:hypothetical protein
MTTENQVAAPVTVPSFTLDDMSTFDKLDQETLVGKITYKGEDGRDVQLSVSAMTTAICNAEVAPRGMTRMLAASINAQLPAVEGSAHWYDTVSTDTTAMAKAFEPIRAEVTSTARARKHSNPAGLIKQLKAQGKLLRENKAAVVKDKDKRDTYKRVSEELLALHKYLTSAQQDPIIKVHPERKKIEAMLVGITKGLNDAKVEIPVAD